MRRFGVSIVAVDILGWASVSVCAGLMLWLTLFRNDEAPARIRELDRLVAAATAKVDDLHAQRDRHRALYKVRHAELVSRGRIPEMPPIEEYFQLLARLAGQFQIEVRAQSPLAPRTYPGLVEHRFSFDVAGSLFDLARFLSAIERSEYWADVSFLKIEAVRNDLSAAQSESETERRIAQLTLSVFSSPRSAANPGAKQG